MTSDDPDAAAIRAMLDEHHLRSLVHRYCRAVDRGDVDALRTLYHDDADDTHGDFSSGSVREFLDGIAAARPYLRSMQHHVTTANFAIAGEVAEGEISMIATHTLIADGRDVDVIVGGRYLDRYEKRDGTWKISARAIVTDTAYVLDPSTRDLGHPITRGTPLGSVGADDPAHAFFTLL